MNEASSDTLARWDAIWMRQEPEEITGLLQELRICIGLIKLGLPAIIHDNIVQEFNTEGQFLMFVRTRFSDMLAADVAAYTMTEAEARDDDSPPRFLAFLGMLAVTVYWGLVLTWPAFTHAGTLDGKEIKLAIILPFAGLIFTFSTLNKSWQIYDIEATDRLLVLIMLLFALIFPGFMSLHKVFQIEIPDSLWSAAWPVSLAMMVALGIYFYTALRTQHHGVGGSILLAVFGSVNGYLLGIIVFKLVTMFG